MPQEWVYKRDDDDETEIGPDLGSTKLDVAIAVEEWKAWWAKQKK